MFLKKLTAIILSLSVAFYQLPTAFASDIAVDVQGQNAPVVNALEAAAPTPPVADPTPQEKAESDSSIAPVKNMSSGKMVSNFVKIDTFSNLRQVISHINSRLSLTAEQKKALIAAVESIPSPSGKFTLTTPRKGDSSISVAGEMNGNLGTYTVNFNKESGDIFYSFTSPITDQVKINTFSNLRQVTSHINNLSLPYEKKTALIDGVRSIPSPSGKFTLTTNTQGDISISVAGKMNGNLGTYTVNFNKESGDIFYSFSYPITDQVKINTFSTIRQVTSHINSRLPLPAEQKKALIAAVESIPSPSEKFTLTTNTRGDISISVAGKMNGNLGTYTVSFNKESGGIDYSFSRPVTKEDISIRR